MNTNQTKMDQAKVIYDEVYGNKDYDLQGKSQRAVFIERAMDEAGLTDAGARSYLQNLRNVHVHGKSLYEYNKRADGDESNSSTQTHRGRGRPSNSDNNNTRNSSNRTNSNGNNNGNRGNSNTDNNPNRRANQTHGGQRSRVAEHVQKWYVTDQQDNFLAFFATRAAAKEHANLVGGKFKVA